MRRVRNAVKWMHRNYRVVLTVLTFILVAILAFGCDAGTTAALAMAIPGTIIDGVDDGKHIVDGPLTTDLTRDASPDLLLNEIDQHIVKIRPMATPLDQISRYGGALNAARCLWTTTPSTPSPRPVCSTTISTRLPSSPARPTPRCGSTPTMTRFSTRATPSWSRVCPAMPRMV